MFGIGIISAATMVVPGVSGSMILLILGYYQPLLDEITGCINGLLLMDGNRILRGIILLGPAVIGVGVGIIVIAKLVEYLLGHHKITSYWAILGLILASPIGIFLEMETPSWDILPVLTGILALGLGLFVTNRLGEKDTEEGDRGLFLLLRYGRISSN